MRMITMKMTNTTAIGLIHLYLGPSVHERAWNESPWRQRRNTGVT